MDVKRAAQALEVEPKKLRQFLRSDEKYSSPGAGGRYDLSGFTVDDLRNAYEIWAKVTTPRVRRLEPETEDEQDTDDVIPALPLGSDRDAVRLHTQERVARLEEMLKARGLHLSQMKDRPTWERVARARTSR